MDDVADFLVDVVKIAFLIFTSPIWLIPFLVWRKIKNKKGKK